MSAVKLLELGTPTQFAAQLHIKVHQLKRFFDGRLSFFIFEEMELAV